MKKDKAGSLKDFAYIFSLIIKTVNPKVHGDATAEIMEDFLNGLIEGDEIFPDDAISCGRAILTTMPGPSSSMH